MGNDQGTNGWELSVLYLTVKAVDYGNKKRVDELVAGRKPRQDSSRDASRDSRNASWVLCWKTERLAHEVANSGPPERPQSDQIKETR